jgi:hypothetical protein
MAKKTIESETSKILAGIQKGKINLKKAGILIADLEARMVILVKEVKAEKAASRRRRNSN